MVMSTLSTQFDDDMAAQQAKNLGWSADQGWDAPALPPPPPPAPPPPEPSFDTAPDWFAANKPVSTLDGPQWQESQTGIGEDMARQSAINHLGDQVQSGAIGYQPAVDKANAWSADSEANRAYNTQQAQSALNDQWIANYLEGVGKSLSDPVYRAPPPDNRSTAEKLFGAVKGAASDAVHALDIPVGLPGGAGPGQQTRTTEFNPLSQVVKGATSSTVPAIDPWLEEAHNAAGDVISSGVQKALQQGTILPGTALLPGSVRRVAGNLASDVINQVPSNSSPLQLAMAVPAAAETVDLLKPAAKVLAGEGAVRLGASEVADKVLPKTVLQTERAGANAARAAGGDATTGSRIFHETGEMGGGAPSGFAINPASAPVQPKTLPDLGDSGIKSALAAKEEALLQPGKVLGDEGSVQRKVVGAINPSVDVPRPVHVANSARTAVQATAYTDFARGEITAAREAKAAFAEAPPTYTGPANNKVKGTVVDFFENPDFYDGVTPRLEAAKDAWSTAQLENVAKARSEFGVDVGAFQPEKPGAVYVPHVESRDAVDTAVQRTAASLSSRGTITKERAYESLADRMEGTAQAKFRPELDLEALADNHAQSLAHMAGNNTFKAGAGGKTLTEVVDETHPGLRAAKEDAAKELDAIKAKIDRAQNTANIQDHVLQPLIKEQAAIDSRAVPRFIATSEADQMTPELKKMQTQLDELRIRARAIDKATTSAGGKKAAAELRLGQAQRDISAAEGRLAEMRARYQSASTGDYVMNRTTFRYHDPATSAAIDSTMKTGFNNAFIDGAIDAGHMSSAAALGPDFSPLSIQGALGAFSHPEVAIQNAAGMVKAFFSKDAMAKALDADLVKRFEFAANRRVGSLSEEFVGDTGRFRVPGQPIKKFNDALERVVDYATVKAFENDSALLMKLGEHSQNVADHEAANALSKVVPRLNNAETARSVQRVKLEGVLPTSRSFTAAPFMLAKDYASGVAKVVSGRPGELLGREKLALIRGSSMLGTMTTAAVSSALISADANKLSPADAVKQVLDPNSPRFLSIVTGNKGSIALGGPFRSAFLGVYRTGTEGPKGAIQYGRGRLQPTVGNVADVAMNRDYRGRPVMQGSQWNQMLDAVTHIAGGANLLAEGAIQGGPTGLLTQASGANFRQSSPYDKTGVTIRGEVEKGTIPATYLDKDGNPQPVKTLQDLQAASPLAAEDFDKRHPDLTSARLATARPETKERVRLEQEAFDAQTKRDSLLATNPSEWRKETGLTNGDLQAKIDENYTLAGEYNKTPTTLKDVAQDKYHQAIVDATTDGKMDWDAVDRAFAGLSPDEQKLLYESRLKGETEPRKEYLQALTQLSPYFDQRDAAWQELAAGDPTLQGYKTFDAFRQEMIAEVHDEGIGWTEAGNKVDAKLAKYNDAIGKQANIYLADNADELLPLLDKYDFYVPSKFAKYVRKAP